MENPAQIFELTLKCRPIRNCTNEVFKVLRPKTSLTICTKFIQPNQLPIHSFKKDLMLYEIIKGPKIKLIGSRPKFSLTN